MFNIIWVPATLHLGISFALHFWPLIFFVWDESIDWRHHRSTGVNSEARPELGVSAQWDGATRPVQEQHLRSGERPLPRPVLLRQWIPVQLRGSLNLEEGGRGRSADCLWCRSARRTTVTMVLLSWEKWPRTLFQSSLGSLFLRRISVRWDKVLMWRNVNQGRLTFSQCQSFSW